MHEIRISETPFGSILVLYFKEQVAVFSEILSTIDKLNHQKMDDWIRDGQL